MNVIRQQAIQIVYALMYGASATARLRLDTPAPPRFVASIKSLLDADIARARSSRDVSAASAMAFYDALPAGSGHEVRYSLHHVFNLAVAHELVRFGCKQGEVLQVVSRIGHKLNKIFDDTNYNIMTLGRKTVKRSESIKDLEVTPKERIDYNIFLALLQVEATAGSAEYFGDKFKEGARVTKEIIIQGPAQLETFLTNKLNDGLFGVFVMELSELAVRITELVQYAPVRKRGRQSSNPPSNWGEVKAQFRVRDRDYDR